MDSFSPCGLLLPFWLGKVMSALLGAVWMVPRLVWVFPGNSWHFHPCPAPLPFLAIPSPPSPGGRCWAAIPEPARREQLIKERVWQLCTWSKQTDAGEALPVLPWPRHAHACCSQKTTPGLVADRAVLPWLCCILCLVTKATYPIAAVIRCIGNASVFITCCQCSFVGTSACNFQNFIGGGFLISFVCFFCFFF